MICSKCQCARRNKLFRFGKTLNKNYRLYRYHFQLPTNLSLNPVMLLPRPLLMPTPSRRDEKMSQSPNHRPLADNRVGDPSTIFLGNSGNSSSFDANNKLKRRFWSVPINTPFGNSPNHSCIDMGTSVTKFERGKRLMLCHSK